MDRAEKLVRHAEVSEKALERYLAKRIKEVGGLCLKYSNPGMAGYPDRVCLLREGKTVWVELKSRGETLTPLQRVRLSALVDMGHCVRVCSSRQHIDALLEEQGYGIQAV